MESKNRLVTELIYNANEFKNSKSNRNRNLSSLNSDRYIQVLEIEMVKNLISSPSNFRFTIHLYNAYVQNNIALTSSFDKLKLQNSVAQAPKLTDRLAQIITNIH